MDGDFFSINTIETSMTATTPLFIVGNGSSSGNLSNAFSVKNNGKVTINQEYTLPQTDGDAAQNITTDGNGNLAWVDARAESYF